MKLKKKVIGFIDSLNSLFLSGFEEKEPDFDVTKALADKLLELSVQLKCILHQAICEQPDCHDFTHCSYKERIQKNTDHFIRAFPKIQQQLALDLEVAYQGDPAATSYTEIILSYPGFWAVMVYRLAHELYKQGVPLIPRIMTEHVHSLTGIDIHPGAQIGEGFFIDHGTGVVIGETCIIGNNVKIYQSVTLGALSFPKDKNGLIIKGSKRHPTIEDNVTIYAGATILGGETVIGKGSIIGGNVWLTKSVPPYSKVTNRPISEMRETLIKKLSRSELN